MRGRILLLCTATARAVRPAARAVRPAPHPHRSTSRLFSVGGEIWSEADVSAPVVELYTKAGCTLCDEATAVLASVRAVAPHTLVAVDITAEGNGEWWDRYKYDIPVLHVDGKYWAKHRVDAGDAIDALEEAKATGAFAARAGRPNAAAAER